MTSLITSFLRIVPGGPPLDVTAEALNSSSIQVRWQALAAHLSNGNVLGYQIAYVISDSRTARSEIVTAYEGEMRNLPSSRNRVSSLHGKYDWLMW